MDLDKAREIFAIRFYHWSVRDLAREIDQGFPLVSSIKGGKAQRFLEIWDSLSTDERRILQSGMVKRCHRDGCAVLGESITREEQHALEKYQGLMSQESAGSRAMWERRLSGQGPVKTLNRGKCATKIKRELGKVLGEPQTYKGSPNDLRYCTPVGPWLIVTHVSARQPPWYFHRIVATGHTYLREGLIDLFIWLGIGQQLVWDLLLDDDDAAGAAISMAVICGHFINAAPKLLEALVYDDIPQAEPEETTEVIPKPRLVKRPKS